MTEELKKEDDKVAKARKKRLAIAAEVQQKKDKSNSREDFRKYFLKLRKKLNLSKSLEEVIWIHLKTIKHDKKELFDKGVENFGYKL